MVAGLTAAISPTPASAAFNEPNFVSSTLEGCRGSVTSGNYTPGGGAFICADAEYTTGNLGKGWNELDLVPHRLTTTLGNQTNATTDYNMIVAGDNSETSAATSPEGYDFISELVVNAAKSDASCTISSGAPGTQTGVTGGVYDAIYRTVTIHQSKGTTCVFDYVMRLSITAAEYNGSSLQAYKFDSDDFSKGKKTVPIPVKDVEPQSISKDMTATQNASHVWEIVKSPTPATLNFSDTCGVGEGATSQSVDIKITWTKLAAVPGGPITVLTHVYATNPSHRIVVINVSDDIRSGTTVLDTATSGDVDVPANTANFLVLTHTFVAPEGTTDLNDVATATYKDKIFPDVPIPGTTTATASATVQTGTTTNTTATINDVESITGANLKYSVDSFAGASGAFDGGYLAGTPTTGNVSWTSDSQSDSGSVTLHKTVYVDPAPAETTGSLNDTATLTGSDGFTAQTQASVAITASASAKITISKTLTSDILQGAETATFNYNVSKGGVTVATTSITFGAGELGPKSVDVTNLPLGQYTVSETPPAGWSTPADINVDLGTSCTGSASFTNSFDQRAAAKVKKVTDPAGYEPGWKFTLYRDNAPAGAGPEDTELEFVITTGAGFENFTTQLGEGSYYILETEQTGWTNQGGSVGCTFSVDLPADANKTFACTFTNTSRGEAKVIKTVSGNPPSGDQSFVFQLREGASTTSEGTILETKTANAANGGTITFTTQLIPGQHYQLCEAVMPGWNTSLNGSLFVPGSMLTPILPNPDVNNVWVCSDFVAGFNETTTFTVDNTPPPGGRALTIGFWKNWASCSKSSGKQANTLDQVLASFSGGGVLIGNLFVDTCQEAVRILSKQDVATGKSMASDPAYNLAAQLLAAKLNVQAGAGVCPAAQTAIDQGQGILDGPPPSNAVTFTGTGSYPKKGTFATDANNLANTLDRYNNNNLC
jgi:hypothetical protein